MRLLPWDTVLPGPGLPRDRADGGEKGDIASMGGREALIGSPDGENGIEILSRRYRSALSRYFISRGCDPNVAPDLVQEVFTRLSERETFAGIASAEGYLFTTAANIATDHFRRRKVRTDFLTETRRHALGACDPFTPERVAEGREELACIVAALNEMPERMRNIFILARIENMPRGEIATRLGISKSLVEQQITLAAACLAERRRRFA